MKKIMIDLPSETIKGFFRLKLKKKGILIDDAMINMISEEVVMSEEEIEETKMKYLNNDEKTSDRIIEEFKVLKEQEEKETNELILEKLDYFPAPQPVSRIELLT